MNWRPSNVSFRLTSVAAELLPALSYFSQTSAIEPHDSAADRLRGFERYASLKGGTSRKEHS